MMKRNLATLSRRPPRYEVSAGDLLDITIPGLTPDQALTTLRVEVTHEGRVHLPEVGAVQIGNNSLDAAHEAINGAFADGVLQKPNVSISVVERSTIAIPVLGEVGQPGVYRLIRGENDVANALAMAAGTSVDAADWIEIHKGTTEGRPTANASHPPVVRMVHLPAVSDGDTDVAYEPISPPDAVLVDGAIPELAFPDTTSNFGSVIYIPLRGTDVLPVYPSDIVLEPGDVVVVPRRRQEVFFVVGRLSTITRTRFGLDAKEREIGSGFLLPPDRDIDVVTAVAMAGYIDPIESPTTATVHRTMVDGPPLLVKVDLIRARYNQQETIFVQPGDIIYLNPDADWWFRTTFNGVVGQLISLSYTKWLFPGN